MFQATNVMFKVYHFHFLSEIGHRAIIFKRLLHQNKEVSRFTSSYRKNVKKNKKKIFFYKNMSNNMKKVSKVQKKNTKNQNSAFLIKYGKNNNKQRAAIKLSTISTS